MWLLLARFYLDHTLDLEASGAPAAATALALAPDDARAHDLVGWAAFLLGDDRAAQTSLERAVALDPRHCAAHYHLGRLWDARGLPDQAAAAYVRALECDARGELDAQIRRAMGDRWPAITQGVLPD